MIHSDCTISIITYTALTEAAECLKAILPTRAGARLILTANGHPDVARYFNWLGANYPDVQVRVNMSNRGFIEPTNEAAKACQTPYFVVLNDDAIPPPRWLSMLKAPFSSQKMAVTGAKGGCCTLDERFVGHKGDRLDYIEFSCAMMRMEHMTTPLFSPEIHWAYTEDADLCLRMRQQGLKIAQADFSIYHQRNTTSRKIPNIRQIMDRNFEVCRKKWSGYLKTGSFES